MTSNQSEREAEYMASRISRYCHEEIHDRCSGGPMTNGRECECPCHDKYVDALEARLDAAQQQESKSE